MEHFFTYDSRLGISVPELPRSFSSYSIEQQAIILAEWENHRGAIPDRVKELEREIDQCLYKLNREEDFEASCRLNNQISEFASTINDLWIWYRTNPHITSSKNNEKALPIK
ncbi:hypothetical protein GCM10007216_25670 [Thalassobacillus devorans]|uniref:Uncharacterized protein n=1 Tax=Thalassobacillus devorans TaxID=279813 RepID=A0ABQ1P9D5_9BACI|nr:hypothetical protein [Thalassobacillus devorans]NIK29908.1 hypothetical protein [Thalassobacillus devorans]GGC93788.1 hypothetical protein GCM10007216_25670 [Thalassobacillus devorans]